METRQAEDCSNQFKILRQELGTVLAGGRLADVPAEEAVRNQLARLDQCLDRATHEIRRTRIACELALGVLVGIALILLTKL